MDMKYFKPEVCKLRPNPGSLGPDLNMTTHLHVPYGCFLDTMADLIVSTKTLWPTKLKILTNWPFIESLLTSVLDKEGTRLTEEFNTGMRQRKESSTALRFLFKPLRWWECFLRWETRQWNRTEGWR